MTIDIVTIFPEVFADFLNNSIIKRALNDGKVKILLHDLRDYSHNKHRGVDDTPYGGGVGMLMSFPPFYDLIMKLRTVDTKVVFLSPQGEIFTQITANQFASSHNHLILLCGHYEGIDARLLELVDYEISIGDYVLTGGELPAMILVDAIVRLIPGVINEESRELDSLQNGLLKYPQYTKPDEYQGFTVPAVLLSGHHQNIALWRQKESLKQTFLKRPDLLKQDLLSSSDRKLLKEIKEEVEKK